MFRAKTRARRRLTRVKTVERPFYPLLFSPQKIDLEGEEEHHVRRRVAFDAFDGSLVLSSRPLQHHHRGCFASSAVRFVRVVFIFVFTTRDSIRRQKRESNSARVARTKRRRERREHEFLVVVSREISRGRAVFTFRRRSRCFEWFVHGTQKSARKGAVDGVFAGRSRSRSE